MKYLLGLAVVMLTAGMHVQAETIRVLGVQEALLSSQAAVAFSEQLEKEFAAEESQLLELEKEAVGVREKIQQNMGLASEEEMNRLQLQFQKTVNEYHERGEALQLKRMEREEAFLAQMRPRLDQAIRTLIEGENINIILAKQATVYSSGTIDLTPRVIELLNQQ
ncbi:OmpH family outer membrane protein [Nitrincola sp. MINF-07-Sa-05]|uniref:OmpH family outer membrane protein n=1 Tax=Nitrincola salilacus TaxID=3400273 RepID=UPI003917E6B7